VYWGRAGAKGVGRQTWQVLSSLNISALNPLAPSPFPWADTARTIGHEVHAAPGKSGGNGCLMRVGPLAVGYLHSAAACAEAARKQAVLTHYDPEAGDACVLWSLAIRHALLTGELGIRSGIPFLPAQRQKAWLDRIDASDTGRRPTASNFWVVAALQCA
jgi:hypothetical protein